jgi:hypothetical protein
MEFYDFPYIGNFIIPTDELIFFRGVGQPPTSFWWHGCFRNGAGIMVWQFLRPANSGISMVKEDAC